MPAPDPLLAASDLDAFPGGPFAAAVVNAAAAAVRRVAGWRIAPSITETLTVETIGGAGVPLMLPTMNLTAITEIRDVTSDPAGVVLTDYRTHATDRFAGGIVDRIAGGWPWRGVVEVDVTHGYDTCPEDLKGVIAEVCRKYVRGDLSQRSLGDKSESWRAELSALSQQALTNYVIPRRP